MSTEMAGDSHKSSFSVKDEFLGLRWNAVS